MNRPVAHPFDTESQQSEAARLGMWIFLATEVMFFGGLFVAYSIYRFLSPEAFHAGSRHMDLVLGGSNTAILIGSSFAMALALSACLRDHKRQAVTLLFVTALLGLVFLGIKGVEYRHKFVEHLVPGPEFHYEGTPPERIEIFFWLYFALTGLHALHVLIGVILIGGLASHLARQASASRHAVTVEICGLYWHFVDVIWVFLFPLFYLAGVR